MIKALLSIISKIEFADMDPEIKCSRLPVVELEARS
jgi:hypothetical protein